MTGCATVAASPYRSGLHPYSAIQPSTSGVVERSTEEARNSSTILRLCRTRSEEVRTTIPGSALREQAGTSAREPSNSTTQTRQTFTGWRVSR